MGFILLSAGCAIGLGNVWRFPSYIGRERSLIGETVNIVLLDTFVAIVIVCFCCWKSGWGWSRFLAEADTGKGLKFPAMLRRYCAYGLPVAILAIFLYGYYSVFMKLG